MNGLNIALCVTTQTLVAKNKDYRRTYAFARCYLNKI